MAFQQWLLKTSLYIQHERKDVHFTLHFKQFYFRSFDPEALWVVWAYKSFDRCLQASGAGRWVRRAARARSRADGCAAAVTLKPWETWRTATTQTDPLHPNPRPRPPPDDRVTWRPPSSLSASSSRLYRRASEWNTCVHHDCKCDSLCENTRCFTEHLNDGVRRIFTVTSRWQHAEGVQPLDYTHFTQLTLSIAREKPQRRSL